MISMSLFVHRSQSRPTDACQSTEIETNKEYKLKDLRALVFWIVYPPH